MAVVSAAAQAALRLYLAQGIGHNLAHKLIETCGSVEAIWQHDATTWRKIPGIGDKLIQCLQQAQSLDIEPWLDVCQQQHIHLVSVDETHYPENLRHIPDAPLLLFVQGHMEALQHPQSLAVVGSRQCSQESKIITRRWSQYLSDHGVHIVSGMAYGIDTAAHGGALQGQNPTSAVLGCGLKQVKGRQIEQVHAIIAHGGCVISEYLPETAPRPELFPRRNRIIAGMTTATLVMEAGLRSGSLITARLANEYGREVFAVPGSVLHEGHRGCHQLVRDGAYLLDDPEHLMQQLNWPTSTTTAEHPKSENAQENQIIQALQRDILHIDALSEVCGLTVTELSTILLALELRGVVERLPGSRYTLGG